MHFVVNNQAPGLLVKQAQVQKVIVLAGPIGEDLVGRQGNRAGRFMLAAVFGNLVSGKSGFCPAVRAATDVQR
jgi:hypothetical protein